MQSLVFQAQALLTNHILVALEEPVASKKRPAPRAVVVAKPKKKRESTLHVSKLTPVSTHPNNFRAPYWMVKPPLNQKVLKLHKCVPRHTESLQEEPRPKGQAPIQTQQ